MAHPLSGTWITTDADSDTAFVIADLGAAFDVRGFCRSTGEAFVISDVVWDGEVLTFTALYPPTDTVTKNAFRWQSDGEASVEITVRETWIKRDVEPGELPEAWRQA